MFERRKEQEGGGVQNWIFCTKSPFFSDATKKQVQYHLYGIQTIVQRNLYREAEEEIELSSKYEPSLLYLLLNTNTL